MTFKEKCKMVQQCLPESPFRDQVTKLHDEMLSLLQEAADDLEDWGGYARTYFQEKHDLKGCVKKYRDA